MTRTRRPRPPSFPAAAAAAARLAVASGFRPALATGRGDGGGFGDAALTFLAAATPPTYRVSVHLHPRWVRPVLGGPTSAVAKGTAGGKVGSGTTTAFGGRIVAATGGAGTRSEAVGSSDHLTAAVGRGQTADPPDRFARLEEIRALLREVADRAGGGGDGHRPLPGKESVPLTYRSGATGEAPRSGAAGWPEPGGDGVSAAWPGTGGGRAADRLGRDGPPSGWTFRRNTETLATTPRLTPTRAAGVRSRHGRPFGAAGPFVPLTGAGADVGRSTAGTVAGEGSVFRTAGDDTTALPEPLRTVRDVTSPSARLAESVVRRYVRVDAATGRGPAPDPVPMTTRQGPAASPLAVSPALATVFAPVPLAGASAAPPLPPDLTQRLIEQVVRALDARGTAERERRGGF